MVLLPDEPNEEEQLEELPEDSGTPFSPPNLGTSDPADDNLDREVVEASLDDTHPATDTEVETEEWYDEGTSGAAEASEPNAGSAVLGYDPEKDQRRKQP